MDVLARAQALEAAGRRVVHMEIGEPDYPPPAPVLEAAVSAMRAGATGYTPALGLPALREAIAREYAERHARQVPPEAVAVTAGASAALTLAAALYVEPGDEFLVADPGYPGYRYFVRLFEGVARPLPVHPEAQFQPAPEEVRASWGRRTRGLILGSPANPTGSVIAVSHLTRIAELVAERGGVLIVDETYQGLVYESEASTALGLPGEVVIVNSFSKYYCMTGWRLGWLVLPPERVREVEKLAQHLYICPPALAQRGALAAFAPESRRVLEERRREYARRRDRLLPALARAGLDVPAPPQGAFYVYADCSRYAPGRDFALRLLEEEAVAATPGVDFGSHRTDRFVRLAYTRSLAELEEGAERIERFCARFG